MCGFIFACCNAIFYFKDRIVFRSYGLKISLWSNDIPLGVVLKRGVFKSEGKNAPQ